MHANLFAADLRPDIERAVRPRASVRQVAGDIAELGEAAVGAAELVGVAERFEDLDRSRSQLAGARAVAGEPVEPREHARAASERLRAIEVAPDLARLLERDDRLGNAVAVVGDLSRLLENDCAVDERQAVEEVERAAVVRVRLAFRAEPRGAAGGGQCVFRDDRLFAGRLGVVDDLSGVGTQIEQALEDLGV